MTDARTSHFLEADRAVGYWTQLADPLSAELAADVTQNPLPAVGTNAMLADRSLEMSPDAMSDLELESSLWLYCRDETRERTGAFLES